MMMMMKITRINDAGASANEPRVLMAESLGFVASQSEASIHSGVMLSLNCELLRTTLARWTSRS